MFVTRTISGIVLIVLMAAVLIAGGPVLWTAVMAISLIGMYELYRLVGVEKKVLGVAGYASAVFYGGLLLLRYTEINIAFPVFLVSLIMAVYVFTFPEFTSDQAMLVFFGVLYIPMMLLHLYQIRTLDDGYLVWLVIIGSWGCDTCAYLVGMKFGKKRLAPILSPKKSVEGAIGGVVGSALLGFLFGAIFAPHLTLLKNPAFGCMIITAAAAVLSQIGDLTASAIKRNNNVKDYGNLIPGHGGILDRFDSMIFVAPVIYYLVRILRVA